jgi:hypothetical protein
LKLFFCLFQHYLNLSSSIPINIKNGQKIEQDRLIQSQQVDQLSNVNNYFYTFNQAGIGKNYIATYVPSKNKIYKKFFSFRLSESETKTTMHLFSDHAGVMIDPFGVGVSNENIHHVTNIPDIRGVRISPRQSPNYQPMVRQRKKFISFSFFFSLFMVQLQSFIHHKLFIQHGGNLNMKIRRKKKFSSSNK